MDANEPTAEIGTRWPEGDFADALPREVQRQDAAPGTVGETLWRCYANLAMAHAAVSEGATRYESRHYAIRARLLSGLRAKTMRIGPLADDERLKRILPQACAYCGSRDQLTADHLVARSRGGPDTGDNLVWACRTCNGSKGARDVLGWLARRGVFPPLLLLRRYLKLAVAYCQDRGLLERALAAAPTTPFDLTALPLAFPPPGEIVLWVVPVGPAPAAGGARP